MQARDKKCLKVAWISYFPVEWLPEVPEEIARLPRQHPASWQRVLLGEFLGNPRLKLHVIVLRKQFSKDIVFDWRGVRFHCLKTPGRLRAPTLFWLDTFRIRRELGRIQPDLIHAWGTENGAGLVASRLKYPHLVTMQGLMSWLGEVIPLNRYQKLVAMLERRTLRRGPRVTAESNFAVKYLKSKFPRLTLHQIEHAPASEFVNLRREPKTNPIRFLFIGSNSYLKGADLAVQALDKIRSARLLELIIIGNREKKWMESLRRMVSPEMWDSIQFREHLSSSEVAEEMAQATMLVCPTRADNSPNAVKEAVVAGVPVVASEVGGIPDYVRHGQNGLLFQPGDRAACEEALRVAIAHPLFSRGEVEPSCLKDMREYLSAAKMGRLFLETYHAVAQGEGG